MIFRLKYIMAYFNTQYSVQHLPNLNLNLKLKTVMAYDVL